MKFINLLLFLMFFVCVFEDRAQHVFEEEVFRVDSAIDLDSDFITISLGCSCGVALFTRLHTIRYFASPFDWCITPYPALYNFIKSDFKDFLKKENMVTSARSHFSPYLVNFFHEYEYLGYMQESESPFWTLDKEAGMFSIHDFPDNSLESINQYHESVHAKYQRRIKRFYDMIHSGKHVYFIRYLDITKSQACELCQLLNSKFPEISFTLIVIGNKAAEFEQDWGIPQIKNFFIYSEYKGEPHEALTWSNNPFWRELCGYISSGKLL